MYLLFSKVNDPNTWVDPDVIAFKKGICKDFDLDCLTMDEEQIKACEQHEPCDVCVCS